MRIVFIGITLFALFFGAGNLIFPVMMGQLSGDHFSMASVGFVITGVMLPLLGVVAAGYSGEKDFLQLAKRIGPFFGLILALALYLTIGPLFAMPRTGSVSYELSLKPFISQDGYNNAICLAMFSFIYFGISCLSSINPTKLIDIVGRYLTPILLIFIVILIAAAIFMPMGSTAPSVKKDYLESPLLTGFIEGYLTMDTLASLIFGIMVVQTFVSYGVKTKRDIAINCLKASIVSGVILAIIYIALSYIGATSINKIPLAENGAQILSTVSEFYFGTYGSIVLGIIVTLACLTTNIGLTIACSNFMSSIFPKISYQTFVVAFSIISGLFTNVGLTNLIAFSVPVLCILYPITMVLIALIFAHNLFNGKKIVYQLSIYVTLFISIIDIITRQFDNANDSFIARVFFRINDTLKAFLPLYSGGLGWLIPAIIAFGIGIFITRVTKENGN